MKRKSILAGTWYPGIPKTLEAAAESYFEAFAGKSEDALAVVAPHAGWIYSGPVAGAVFASVNVPETCVIISPNHTGMGAGVAVWAEGSWETPLGEVPVDAQLCRAVLEKCEEAEEDTAAHLDEHSIEIELPFLKLRQPRLSIAPITLSMLTFAQCSSLSHGIAAAIKESGKKVLLVASTDMTHYESHEAASKKDRKAIDRILALDSEGLYNVVRKDRISMCGYIPTAVVLSAAVELGARTVNLVKYDTSGTTSGDYDRVVGYAGISVR